MIDTGSLMPDILRKKRTKVEKMKFVEIEKEWAHAGFKLGDKYTREDTGEVITLTPAIIAHKVSEELYGSDAEWRKIYSLTRTYWKRKYTKKNVNVDRNEEAYNRPYPDGGVAAR